MGLIELKPCPFCGGKAGLYHTHDGRSCVQCDECGISTLRKMDARLAIQMWNKRNSEIEWIPVSEGLPAGLEDVLATVYDKRTGYSAVWHAARIRDGWAISDCSNYREIYDTDTDTKIIAWAFLPEPYKEARGNE